MLAKVREGHCNTYFKISMSLSKPDLKKKPKHTHNNVPFYVLAYSLVHLHTHSFTHLLAHKQGEGETC